VSNTDVIAALTGALALSQTIEDSGEYSMVLDDQWIDETSLQTLQTGLTILS
jgi:hypothetical protein